ncbi:hypothetical protein L332_13015 [Agrococcus pavilionensis RW1]|uniref:Uncharacterized protein n=1 Tax=Agrococcus pavilionensis RW1 TaxID=1330458 RepID=U1LS48_9MICO|nr:hypothetical protein [Agrococcus pavilionensis]ERG65354.1 hypothetical protein L332_13015 [Agrococcus pavilionensis RW1]
MSENELLIKAVTVAGHATVIAHDGEVLGDYTLNPDKSYQPRND